MRKVTQNTVNAFLRKQEYRQSNTSVEIDPSTNFYTLKLHGNPIAYIDGRNSLWISDAGWPTVTTKERLNALPGVSIYQKNFKWYLNGNEWGGTWTRIGKIQN